MAMFPFNRELLLTCDSLAAFSGRPHTITSIPDMNSMREWLDDPLATEGDRMLVGFLELRELQVRLISSHPDTISPSAGRS